VRGKCNYSCFGGKCKGKKTVFRGRGGGTGFVFDYAAAGRRQRAEDKWRAGTGLFAF